MDSAVDQVKRLVHRATGVVLTADYVVHARLHAMARERGVGEDELVAHAASAQSPALRRALVEAMLPYDSAFFRDHHPFEALRTEVLPTLIAARRAERRLRLWSAGCGAGQEPYSLAILILEHFPELETWDVEILASDVSALALQAAIAGRYDLLEINRGLPARLVPRWFTLVERQFAVNEAVRGRVRFHRTNLVGAQPEIGPFDLVLFRNVLAHLDVACKRTALHAVRERIAPDGHLLLGVDEAAESLSGAWRRVTSERAAWYVPVTAAARAS